MDISAISSIPVTPSLAVSSTRPVSFLFFTPAISDVTSVETVDISALGRLLSAVSIFESTVTSQASFSTVLAGAQFLVDAFNEFLQSDSLQSPLGGSLGNLFVRMLEAQTAGASESGESVLASLSRIGINFVPSESLSGSGSIAIDLETIQAAFNTDPSGTVGVLRQAGRAIASAASEFTNLFLRTADLTQSSQGLLDTDLFGGAPASAATAAAAIAAGELPAAEAAAVTAATGTVVTAATGAALPAAATSPTDTATLEELVATTLATVEAGAAARATVGEAGTIIPSTLPAAAAATAGVESAQAATAPAAELPAAATTAPATLATPSAAIPVPTPATVATATTATNEPVAAPPAEEIAAATTLPLPATAGAAEAAPPAAAAPATPTSRAAPATPAAPAPLRTPGTLAAEEAAAALLTGRAAAVATPSAAPATAVTAVPAPLLPSPDLTVDASNPAVAAAIAAYHVIDGIFDSSKAGSERTKVTFPGYSDIRPVVPVRPGRLDLHA